jgi:hypothetical protein
MLHLHSKSLKVVPALETLLWRGQGLVTQHSPLSVGSNLIYNALTSYLLSHVQELCEFTDQLPKVPHISYMRWLICTTFALLQR